WVVCASLYWLDAWNPRIIGLPAPGENGESRPCRVEPPGVALATKNARTVASTPDSNESVAGRVVTCIILSVAAQRMMGRVSHPGSAKVLSLLLAKGGNWRAARKH